MSQSVAPVILGTAVSPTASEAAAFGPRANPARSDPEVRTGAEPGPAGAPHRLNDPVRDRTTDVPCEELAGRSGAGDREAFGTLVERHTERVFNLLWQWTGNRSDAEDLTQETFVRAFASIRRFDPARPFLPWLLAIARRAAASHWRKARPTEPLGAQVEEPASPETPASHLTAAEDAASVWAVARRLKPRQFQVLWLHYGEGLAVSDIARILGLTRIHVKVLLHRARAALARKLS